MSLKKIAEMAGVAPSTVSRVLNDRSSGCASKEVREKIWASAHALGYVPNEAARTLKSGACEEPAPVRIGVILSRIQDLSEDPFFYELFRAVEVSLFTQSCVLNVVAHSPEELTRVSAPDGLIILGRCSDDALTELQKITPNIVGIWRNPMNYQVDEVVCDGAKAAELAMEHLLSLGHKKIGYIGDWSHESRYVGYCQTLIRHGLPLDYNRIMPTNQTRDQGERAMTQLLERDEVTAVLCANDITATGALRALKRRRAQKHPVSVISIDNIEQSQQTVPMLTTVDIPRADMAHMAVKILTDRINKGHIQCLRVEFPCKIIQRESCVLCYTHLR